MDNDERLQASLDRARVRLKNGIGTQSERLVHTMLKYYLEPDESAHEIKVGSRVADIFQKETGHIYEIQTRGFERLRDKLKDFLEDYRVTVVYPVDSVKYLSWIDPETGEATKRHKSPRKGMASDILPEIYKIPQVMNHPHLEFLVVLMEMEEYKLLSEKGKDWKNPKRGAVRMERLPLKVDGMVTISRKEDYLEMIPDSLPERFDRQQLMKALKLTGMKGSQAITVLERAGAILHVDTVDRKYIYQRDT